MDSSGKRKRRFRTLGFIGGGIAGGYAVMLGLSFVGGPVSPHSLLPVPGVPTAAVVVSGPQPDSGSMSPVSKGELSRSAGSKIGTSTSTPRPTTTKLPNGVVVTVLPTPSTAVTAPAPPATTPAADPTTAAAPTTTSAPTKTTPAADPTKTTPAADPTTSPAADPTTSPAADPTSKAAGTGGGSVETTAASTSASASVAKTLTAQASTLES